jgi:hypothetical protein
MDSSGMSLGGFNYFPITGVPSLGISNPYGVSFWSPYQASLNSLYFPSYLYGPYYTGWPTQILIYPRPAIYPLRIGTGIGSTGLRPGVGILTPRPPLVTPRPAVVRPLAPARVVGRH